MQTWIYPVNGDTDRNVRVSTLPVWVQGILGKRLTFVPAFGRLWMSPHLNEIVRSADDLYRYDALIAQYSNLLEQQAQFPVWGIGWWIERMASHRTRAEQDIPAIAAFLRSFSTNPGTIRALTSSFLVDADVEYRGTIEHGEFAKRVIEHATMPLEAGGM